MRASKKSSSSAGRGSRRRDSPAGTYPISTGTLAVEADPYREDSWIFKVNGVPSSHLCTSDPLALEFEYMRWIAAALDSYVPAHLDVERLRVTHLGGAGCSLARWCSARWPSSRNTVVEFDAHLAALVRELFDLPRSPQLKIRASEAREVIAGARPGSRDVVIRDVFAGATTPRHVCTAEFTREVAESLSETGLYVVNCGDHADLEGAAAEIATIGSVFPSVGVIADPPMLKGRRYGNIIILGAFAPLPDEGSPAAAQLMKALLGGAVPARYVPGERLPRRLRGGEIWHDGEEPRTSDGSDAERNTPPTQP